jgi:hypothetical protein
MIAAGIGSIDRDRGRLGFTKVRTVVTTFLGLDLATLGFRRKRLGSTWLKDCFDLLRVLSPWLLRILGSKKCWKWTEPPAHPA